MLKPQHGIDGLSAYEIAVAKGFKGSSDEWFESLRGAPGRDGADGKDADPEQVKALVAEAVAEIPKPKDGATGKKGDRGDVGPRGEPGLDGKDAILPQAKPWSARFERNARLETERVVVTANDGSAAWNLKPAYADFNAGLQFVRLLTHVDIAPVA